MIPYARQQVLENDIEAVKRVLRSKYLTQGPIVPRFESAVRIKVNAKHGIAVNSATAALHLACLALGLGPGDWLWTVPNTFVASANCGRYCGANVDFVDIDRRTGSIDVSKLREKLVNVSSDGGELPKVLVPVHFAGQPTDQQAIWELARQFDFRVVEDASHALGASRNGEPVGSCRWSDIVVFSFHPVKIITTGEGGMAVTNDDNLAKYMRLLRDQGITRKKDDFETVSDEPWYYEQQVLGFNYRMTDVQAALGISQLKRLSDLVNRRNYLARRYDEAFRSLPIRHLELCEGNTSSYHLYVIRLMLNQIQYSHRQIFDGLRERGIGVNLHYLPVHLQPYYQNLGFENGMYPEAELYSKEAITLPLYPDLTDAMQDEVISAVKQLL